jgi:hypothetical protein
MRTVGVRGREAHSARHVDAFVLKVVPAQRGIIATGRRQILLPMLQYTAKTARESRGRKRERTKMMIALKGINGRGGTWMRLMWNTEDALCASRSVRC